MNNNIAHCTQLVNEENIEVCKRYSPRTDIVHDNTEYFRNLKNYCKFLESVGFKVYNDGKSKFVTTFNKNSKKTVSLFCYHTKDNDNFLLDNNFNSNVDKYVFNLDGRNISVDAKKVIAYTQSLRKVETCQFGDHVEKVHIPDEWVRSQIK